MDFKNPTIPPTCTPSSFEVGLTAKHLMNVFNPSIISTLSFKPNSPLEFAPHPHSVPSVLIAKLL